MNFLKKLMAPRRMTDLANAIYLYALAIGELMNVTDASKWPKIITNGSLIHSRMTRRSFQAAETVMKLDKYGDRLNEFTHFVIDSSNKMANLRNIKMNITCATCADMPIIKVGIYYQP